MVTNQNYSIINVTIRSQKRSAVENHAHTLEVEIESLKVQLEDESEARLELERQLSKVITNFKFTVRFYKWCYMVTGQWRSSRMEVKIRGRGSISH